MREGVSKILPDVQGSLKMDNFPGLTLPWRNSQKPDSQQKRTLRNHPDIDGIEPGIAVMNREVNRSRGVTRLWPQQHH